MEERKIRYRNLSTPLKIAVVSAWVIGVYFAVAFGIGFLIGMFSVV